MNNSEILRRAQLYIEAMANGINPLTGEEIREDDFINDPKIIRCLFYVNDRLKKSCVFEERRYAEDFVYDQEKIDLVKISKEAISLTDLIKNVKKVFGRCRLTYKQVNQLLVDEGMMEYDNNENKKFVATELAKEKGIRRITRQSKYGLRDYNYYDENGQRYVLSLLKKLSAETESHSGDLVIEEDE